MSYSDVSLLGNTEYIYRVSVIDSEGKKSSSNEDSATTFSFMNKISQVDSTAPSINKINLYSFQNGTQTLGLNNKLIGYSNVIPTQVLETGVEKRVQISVSDNNGIAAIKHIGILMYPADDVKKGDTYFVYDEGAGLTVSDPLEIFGDVKVERTFTKTEMLLTFIFTPQKPMPITDVVINSWDDGMNSKNSVIPAAFKIQGEPVSKTVSALMEPVQDEKPKPRYVLDKDGNMIPYDSFGNLDNKFLRDGPEPFVYPSSVGKLHRTNDGFYDVISEERIRASKIAEKLVIAPFSEPGKIFKVDKVFKYPKNVGKSDRRDAQSIETLMEKENTKAQNK